MSQDSPGRALSRIRRRASWSHKAQHTLGRATGGEQALTWQISTHVGEVDLVARESDRRLSLQCSSADPLTARSLRAMLVTKATLTAEPEEHHVLAEVPARSAGAAGRIVREAMVWADTFTSLAAREATVHEGSTSHQHSLAQGIWYDRRPNFGDAVGPWLVATMTGKDVVNVRRTRETPTKARGRATLLVGSIIQTVNRNNVDIWGSGLMRALSPDQVKAFSRLRNIRVHAVRGELTAAELRNKLGWDVPEVYGDPALLLPRHLPVEPSGDHLVLVPHLKHRAVMGDLHSPGLVTADVRDDLETVVTQIASARVCISTSLHGIIVAQAYGVPWLWLNVTDSPVDGRDFKFDDFFTTVDASAVSRADVPLAEVPDLNISDLARAATLPELRTDLDRLEASLPVRRARAEPQTPHPPRPAVRRVPRRVAQLLKRTSAQLARTSRGR